MQIRFQKSDLSILETHPLTPGLTIHSSGSTVPITSTVAVGSSSLTTSGEVLSTAGAGKTSTPMPELTVFTTISAGRPITQTYTVSKTISASSSPSIVVSASGLESHGSLQTGIVVAVALLLIATFATILYVIFRAKTSRGSRWRGLVPNSRWIAPTRLGIGTSRPIIIEETSRQTVLGPVSQICVAELEDSRVNPLDSLALNRTLGSKDNPAELEADQSQHLSEQASWISRMLSRVARSSSASTRSSSRSRWTQRSLATSGDWETFIQEKTGRPSREPWISTAPEAVHSRPASCLGDDGRSVEKAGPIIGPPKLRSFDRLSQGTFGKVIVRGRSPAPTQRNVSRSSSNGR